jgi:lipoprotein-releasing system ATP-binding protein
MSDAALELSGIERTFLQGGRQLNIFRGVDLSLSAGEIVALVGPSGAGKSSLLHIAGLLEAPDAGDVKILGRSTQGLADNARTEIRRHNLGFVYQYHHLLPEFSALENVMMPQLIAGVGRRAARTRAAELLGHLRLDERLDHRPAALSGGEQQRVAIARALANAPKVVLADEPTGNLDGKTAAVVFDELMTAVRDSGVAALIVTHNPDIAAAMDRVLIIENGALRPG